MRAGITLALPRRRYGIGGGAGAFTPLSLFTTGVNGAWYDPSDFSTMFQDAAGTTPVTAVEQPVGLMLDKSKGLVLGPELVTNGDFSNGTTGWSSNAAEISVSNGRLTVSDTGNLGSWSSAVQKISVISGKTYKLTFDIISTTTGYALALHTSSTTGGGAPSQVLTEGGMLAGSKSFIFTATSAQYLFLEVDGTGTTVFDNISVRELPGNHAFNPSGNSANFPVLQQDGTGRYYLAFNGVNQWLQTNSIDFTYGDKMFVSAGARYLTASIKMFAELSAVANSNAGSFYISLNESATGLTTYRVHGTVFGGGNVPPSPVAPNSSVLSLSMDSRSGSAIPFVSRINAIAQTGTTAGGSGTGNFGNYPLYIGARGGASLWFNGRLYGLVVAGKTASASEIASTESWLNQKTGAY